MKTKLFSLTLIAALLSGSLAACGGDGSPPLVNTVELDQSVVHSMSLDYDADDIRLLESPDTNIILKEYMSEDKKSYYAQVRDNGKDISITEGERPRRTSFVSYVELYLPVEYTGSLSLHSTSGKVDSSITLRLNGHFAADTTSGTMSLSDIEAADIIIITTSGTVTGAGLQADTISAKITSGKLELERINAETITLATTSAGIQLRDTVGAVTYTTTSGELTGKNLDGSGNFQVSGDGGIILSFANMTGDTSVMTKNGDIFLTVPSGLSYSLSATTKDGSINTPYADMEIHSGAASGMIGENPGCSVYLESRNGSITVLQP